MTRPISTGHSRLSDEELDRIAAFLGSIKNPDALTLEGLDGFFCALVAGPDMVMPSEYLPLVWGGELPEENAFESAEAAYAFIGLLTRHWNAIAAEYETDGVYYPLFDAPDERGVPGRNWARGYMRGVALRRSSWIGIFKDESEGLTILIPIVAGEVDPGFPKEIMTAERTEETALSMAAGAGRAYRYFSEQRRSSAAAAHEAATYRRSQPKIGRNEPCPCGSGKKFKQCCGRLDEPVL
jgi:uncharacterized protein